jgi:hypothetical protein
MGLVDLLLRTRVRALSLSFIFSAHSPRADGVKAATSSQVHMTAHCARLTAARPSYTLRPCTRLPSRPFPSCHRSRAHPPTRICTS